jgi:hypothetical protein
MRHKGARPGNWPRPFFLRSAWQIAVTTLLPTLSIYIGFIPMFLLAGVAHYLFVPLAVAGVFALSRRISEGTGRRMERRGPACGYSTDTRYRLKSGTRLIHIFCG